MSKKSKKQVRKQVPASAESGLIPRVGQMLLPMIAGIAATKADLTKVTIHEAGRGWKGQVGVEFVKPRT